MACEGHQIIPNFDRAKFKHNMFVDEITKSNEPVVMVKFIVSGKVSVFGCFNLMRVGNSQHPASLYLQVRNKKTLSTFIRLKGL